MMLDIFYGLLAILVIGTAVGVIISRNAIYSALFLVVNFFTVAMIYLILGAPFIALVQVTVYAGSIMVLFIFVIMLLGAERLTGSEPIRGQRIMAFILGGLFLVEVSIFLLVRSGGFPPIDLPGVLSGAPKEIGAVLFTQYALPFEVTGFILLVATIGAILLTRGDNKPAVPPTPQSVEEASQK